MPSRFFPNIPHSNPTDLDEKEKVGRYGEDYAARVLNKIPGVCYVRNPLIPQPRKQQVIPYRTISAVEIQAKPYQEIKITSMDGRTQTFNYKDGAVRLNRFKGEQQIHSFDNIRQVIVGVANRFR